MTRFFKSIQGRKELKECTNALDAEFIEVYWNHEAWAVPMVLGLSDAVNRYNNRFKLDAKSNTFSVISPKIWLALFEHNKQYCTAQEADILSKASLAMRPS